MKKRERRYTTVAILRISKDIKSKYMKEAKSLGLSYSELMRRVLVKRYEA